MTPFSPGQDVFQTQADQRFNTFSSPLNAVNSNSGDWGMNSAYMTPSYTSPYRPRYTGPQGNQDSGYKPGFFNSANHIINPFERGGTNYGGNSYAQDRPYYDAIGMRPIDAGAQAMQNVFVPIAASYAAFKYTSKAGSAIGSSFGGNLIGGLAKPMGPAMAGRMAGLGRMAGGFAGSIAVPMAVAQGVTSAVDGAIFDPYIAQRQTANSLQRNTFGISYGEGNGNQVTGGGMSRQFAARQAGNISQMAARDVTFSQQEVSQLTDFAGRSGLMDNISGSQMSKRMTEITRQVKTVMAVANTSDFREAIEIMSKLQSSGVGSQRLSGTMGAIGGLASAAGMSTQRMMNTIGLQGQYLYGANGLTPYVGQLTAGQSAASFGTAFRSGLISPALMARMGGVEGATQSANSGLLASLSTPYAGIMGMNAFQGGASGSIVGNMSKFGGGMAANPISAMGKMNLLRPELTSNMAQNQGLGMLQMQLDQMADVIPGIRGKNGKIDAYSAHMLMTGMMGLTEDQSRANLLQLSSIADPKSRRLQKAGMDRAQQDYFMKFADQQSMNKGIFTPLYNSIANTGRSIQHGGATSVSNMLESVGGGTDAFEGWWTEAKYGEDDRSRAITAEDFVGGKKYNQIDIEGAKRQINKSVRSASRLNLTSILNNNSTDLLIDSKNLNAITAINKAAAEGDEDARRLTSSSSRQERLLSIKNLSDKGLLPKRFGESSGANELDSLVKGSGTLSVADPDGQAAKQVSRAIFETTGMTDSLKSLEVMSLAQKLTKDPTDTGNLDRISKLTGKDVNATNVKEFVGKINRNMAISGTMNMPDLYDDLGMNSDELAATFKDRKKYDALLKKTGVDSATNSHEFLAKFAAKKKRNLLEKGFDRSKTSAMTDEAAVEFMETTKGIQGEKSRLDTLASQNQIDFSDYYQSVAALDNKKSSLDFTAAVDKFGLYVDALATGKSIDDVAKARNKANVNPAQPA